MIVILDMTVSRMINEVLHAIAGTNASSLYLQDLFNLS